MNEFQHGNAGIKVTDADLVLHVLEQSTNYVTLVSFVSCNITLVRSPRTDSSKVNDMGRLVLLEKLLGLLKVSTASKHIIHASEIILNAYLHPTAHLRSPSDDVANIHVSPSFLPKRDPAGSVSITCLIACPMRPVPPVTRITSDIAQVRVGEDYGGSREGGGRMVAG